MKKIIAISFIFCIALVACKSKKEIVKKDKKIEERAQEKLKSDTAEEAYDQNQMPKDSEGDILKKKALAKLSDSLVARIQRTACFGRCPIYTVSIYKSGYVDYVGEKWVQREGHFQSTIPQEKIQDLLIEAKKINFQGLDDIYDSNSVTDLPSTILTLRFEEGPKIVVSRYQAPEILREFEQYFDQIVEELTYEKVTFD